MKKIDYQKLQRILQDLREKMYVDNSGNCIHFVEEFLLRVVKMDKKLLGGLSVIEGYVDVQDDAQSPYHHVWLEFGDGEKIDPTFAQFKGVAKYRAKSDGSTTFIHHTALSYYQQMLCGTWFFQQRKSNPQKFFKKY